MAAQARIAYRDSKLTRVLKGSLEGSGRTAIICCINPTTSACFCSVLHRLSVLACRMVSRAVGLISAQQRETYACWA